MAFTWTDFFIGFFLMNAMPHLIVGIANIRFLSLFGYTGVSTHFRSVSSTSFSDLES